MATKTIESMGYVILREENGYQHLQKKDAVQTPGIEGYLVRRKPKPNECQLDMGFIGGTPCMRPDRDCDLCMAEADLERKARAEAYKHELADEKEHLAALPSLPEGQVRVWRSLVNLCGCSGISIGQVRGQSVFVKVYPEDRRAYRIDKAIFDSGKAQYRDSWSFEKFNPEKQAAEAIQDRNWQD